jgi:hypothetical protein
MNSYSRYEHYVLGMTRYFQIGSVDPSRSELPIAAELSTEAMDEVALEREILRTQLQYLQDNTVDAVAVTPATSNDDTGGLSDLSRRMRQYGLVALFDTQTRDVSGTSQ